jgi:hypothetical protein
MSGLPATLSHHSLLLSTDHLRAGNSYLKPIFHFICSICSKNRFLIEFAPPESFLLDQKPILVCQKTYFYLLGKGHSRWLVTTQWLLHPQRSGRPGVRHAARGTHPTVFARAPRCWALLGGPPIPRTMASQPVSCPMNASFWVLPAALVGLHASAQRSPPQFDIAERMRECWPFVPQRGVLCQGSRASVLTAPTSCQCRCTLLSLF